MKNEFNYDLKDIIRSLDKGKYKFYTNIITFVI